MHFDTFQLKKNLVILKEIKVKMMITNAFLKKLLLKMIVCLNVSVFHLIFGNDFSQETILYNIFTINYIKNQYNNIPNNFLMLLKM